MNDLRNSLQRGAKQLELSLSDEQTDRLLAYLALLVKWNNAYNLTAVRHPQDMISRHLLDSLSVMRFLTGQRFVDVGTGAGLPGVVLAIMQADNHFTLIDSNGKKTRFLTQVKAELALTNVDIQQARVEKIDAYRCFDGVLSRAFSNLQDLVDKSAHLLTPDGYFYAMKGVYPQEELSTLPKAYNVKACHPLSVPGEPGDRHLVVIANRRVADEENFPRGNHVG